MALSSTPSRDEIYQEMADSFYRNGGADNNSMHQMFDAVFNDADPYSRKAFANAGVPEFGGSTYIADFTDTTVTVGVNVNPNTVNGMFNASIFVEYGTDSDLSVHTDSNDDGISGTSGFNYEMQITGLDPNTTYYFRFAINNDFNDASDSTYARSSIVSQTTDAGCEVPENVDATAGSFVNSITWDHPASGQPSNGYDIQYNTNNQGWNHLASVSSSTTSHNHQGCNSEYVDGDAVNYRVKAKCTNADSSWVQTGQVTANCGI